MSNLTLVGMVGEESLFTNSTFKNSTSWFWMSPNFSTHKEVYIQLTNSAQQGKETEKLFTHGLRACGNKGCEERMGRSGGRIYFSILIQLLLTGPLLDCGPISLSVMLDWRLSLSEGTTNTSTGIKGRSHSSLRPDNHPKDSAPQSQNCLGEAGS